MPIRRICMALMTVFPFAAPFGASMAGAEGPVAGASLGLAIVSDQLTGRDDFLGAGLLPAPSMGAHLRRAPESSGALGWDLSVEFALFESDSDSRIRIFYVPVEAGVLLGVTTVQDVALDLRCGVGGALVSGSLESTHETIGVGILTLGGQMAYPIHRLSVVLGIEAGVLWQERPQSIFQVRLALLTG